MFQQKQEILRGSPQKTKVRVNSFKRLQILSKLTPPKKSFSLKKLTNTSKEKNIQKNDIKLINRLKAQQDHISRMRKSILTHQLQANNPFRSTRLSPKFRKSKYIQKLTSISNSPVKQYETILRISAQSWLSYDYRKDSYNRGWRVADKDDFSGLIRLVLLKAFIKLSDVIPDLMQFQARLNTCFLQEQIQLKRQQRRSPQKKRGIIFKEYKQRCFVDNTVAKMIYIFYALFMTNCEDIIQYTVIILGYLAHCHRKGIDPTNDQPCFYVEKQAQAFIYQQYFAEYAQEQIFNKLQMSDSKITKHYLQSTPNDICRLYLSLENNQFLNKILACQEITCNIKYQVGFKYWQNRVKKLKNHRLDLGPEYAFTMCWQSKKYYAVLCHNKALNILIILGDCRHGMAEPDIHVVENWIKSTRKPIVDFRKTHMKLLPIMRLNQHEQQYTKQSSKQPKHEKEQVLLKNF